jgi:hypothetical protein
VIRSACSRVVVAKASPKLSGLIFHGDVVLVMVDSPFAGRVDSSVRNFFGVDESRLGEHQFACRDEAFLGNCHLSNFAALPYNGFVIDPTAGYQEVGDTFGGSSRQ